MPNETDTSVVEQRILRALFEMDVRAQPDALSTVELRIAARLLGMEIEQPTGDTDRLLRDMVVRGLLSTARPRIAGSNRRRARLFWLTADGHQAARQADRRERV